MKKHNFSAGPCILPQSVMQQAAEAVVELDNSGLSLIEISHRSPAFVSIMDKATSLALELLGLEGKGYQALFLQGGASQQFLNVAYNLLENKAGYANTGTWSTKAMKEAKLLGEVVELSSSKDANFNYIPKGFDIPSELNDAAERINQTPAVSQARVDAVRSALERGEYVVDATRVAERIVELEDAF